MIISWLLTKNLDITRLLIFRVTPKVIKKQFICREDEFPVLSWFYADKMFYCVELTENEEIQITKTEPIELN